MSPRLEQIQLGGRKPHPLLPYQNHSFLIIQCTKIYKFELNFKFEGAKLNLFLLVLADPSREGILLCSCIFLCMHLVGCSLKQKQRFFAYEIFSAFFVFL